jgi:hypothetical protein
MRNKKAFSGKSKLYHLNLSSLTINNEKTPQINENNFKFSSFEMEKYFQKLNEENSLFNEIKLS